MLECPKCGKPARIIEDAGCKWLRCFCGVSKLLEKRDGVYKIRHTVTAAVRLPKAGSFIHDVLMVVHLYGDAFTDEVAHKVKAKSGVVGSALSALEACGLVDKMEDRKGKAGGSRWVLTQQAKDLLD